MSGQPARQGGGKVFIKTFGCQMNEYDSQKIADVLGNDSNYQVTSTMQDADIIIFNTCSIRDKAQEKVFSDLGRVKHLKQINPDVIIAVGGCVASQEGSTIIKRAPYVDVVFGPQTIHRIAQLINAKRQSGKAQVDITFPEIEKFDSLPLPNKQCNDISAFVSIMEGCSKYCSYCVVPYTRGEEISRPLDSILHEIHQLVNNGAKEIHLLGQNVNAYRGTINNCSTETVDFAFLLEAVHAISGVKRIRYTTSHPKEMTARIIECHGSLPKLAAHLHLPAQSGSDRILAAMKRGYTCLEYKSIIRKLKDVCPHMSFSSDFIVGFPGETDEDFMKSMDLIDFVGYDTSFSFIFSKRPGTPAANIPDNTPQQTKLERLYKLQQRLAQTADNVGNNMLGLVQYVLVDGKSKRNSQELTGRNDNCKVVNFSGDDSLIGQMVRVKITAVKRNTLRGELVK